jgi:LAO/AO transport system kinase
MPPAQDGLHGVNPELVERLLNGDFRSIARLITLVENSPEAAGAYLRELFPHTGTGLKIGVTGAPGSGKSTLVDQLARYYREEDRKVGIIAVDPTSPYSGGAILGDRIRMQSRSVDPGTFIRSMATRGHLGGLARATGDVLNVLDAAGFDPILVETVGVGQDEVDIVRTADITLVVLVPGMGDDIQAMKAGIMEIGDVFAINKAERPGADRVEVELKALISMSARSDGWKPPVVRTIAAEGKGIAECAAAIDSYRTFARSSEFQRERLVRIQRERLLDLARSLVLEPLLKDPESRMLVERLAHEIADRDTDPYSAAEQLLQRAPVLKPGLPVR